MLIKPAIEISFKTICSFDIHEASPRYSAIKGDNGSKCVGCHLCKLVCPNDAIEAGKKRIKKMDRP